MTPIVTDFNHTLVREGLLTSWCLGQMARGSLGQRLRAVSRTLRHGLDAITRDLAGDSVGAATIGLAVLAGTDVSTFEAWARRRLRLNPFALAALATVRRERTEAMPLLVISRGSPGHAIRALLADESVLLQLSAAGIDRHAIAIAAPELEVIGNRFSGRLLTPPLAKSARAESIPAGAVFLGDRNDARWVRRTPRDFRFVRIGRG